MHFFFFFLSSFKTSRENMIFDRFSRMIGKLMARSQRVFFFVFLSFFGYLQLKKDKQILEKEKTVAVKRWCETLG